jgi:poly(3-hydroxybutyrate) depolymerase
VNATSGSGGSSTSSSGGASVASGGAGGTEGNASAGASGGDALDGSMIVVDGPVPVTEGGNGFPSGPTQGCGKEVMDPPRKWIQHDMTVNVAPAYVMAYAKRKYYTMLPNNYDPMKPYPVIFYGAGCGATQGEGGPFTNNGLTDNYVLIMMIPAIDPGKPTVPPQAAPGCFQAGSHGTADSPDGPYFDQALAEVEAGFCVDKGKVFVAGWSSGAWISTYLACARGGVVRGIGTSAGGIQADHGPCVGNTAIYMVASGGDGSNPIKNIQNGVDIGSGAARDLFLKQNGCTAQTMGFDPTYPECQIYQGCKVGYPVVWCMVGGGHSPGGDTLAKGAWKFWSSLP